MRCLRNPELPMVSTLPLSNITSNTAVCGGNVSSNGGVEVTARGVCWSTTPNPTITDNRTVDSCGIGQFISNIIDLRAHTTYYVRAYATNSIGTAYGEETSFTTLDFTCGTLIYDYDNNKYNTIQIGNQCWMKENLRTTKYADGTSITQGISTSTTLAYWYFPNNNSTNMATYGLLYNWKAVMHYSSSSNTNPSGVQGICPSGWHVPSDAEWTQLTDYVGSQEEYQCDANSAKIAKALASQTGWESYSASDTPGNNPGTNNATGFSARPAGGHLDAFGFFGTHTWLWSATECSVDAALTRAIGYNGAYVSRGNDDKFYGFSVRCLRD